MSKIDLNGEKVLVIGSGLSGIGAVKLLREAGAIPVLLDENEKAVVSDIRSRLRIRKNITAIFHGRY